MKYGKEKEKSFMSMGVQREKNVLVFTKNFYHRLIVYKSFVLGNLEI